MKKLLRFCNSFFLNVCIHLSVCIFCTSMSMKKQTLTAKSVINVRDSMQVLRSVPHTFSLEIIIIFFVNHFAKRCSISKLSFTNSQSKVKKKLLETLDWKLIKKKNNTLKEQRSRDKPIWVFQFQKHWYNFLHMFKLKDMLTIWLSI